MKTFKEQTENMFKSKPYFSNKTLGDITHNSWFSIIWTPSLPTQTKFESNYKSIDFNQFNSSFKVFYQFRNATVTKTAHFLSIAGILNNSICKKNSDAALRQLSSFWFSNFSNNMDNNQLLQNKVNNNNLFYTLVENVCRLEYFNISF